jgi:FAD/FMN-containing dehydrogenase
MDSNFTYARKRDLLAAELGRAPGSGAPLALNKTTSNLFRARREAPRCTIDVRSFRAVIAIHPSTRTADVEGMTTYETAVRETLRYGLLPAVSPQLKTITVGGAVSGVGIESSSFRHGLVHETIEEMEILLSQGEVIRCSPSENADLYYGFPNSYGTLGYALRLRIRLIEAAPYVKLIHTRFSDASEYFPALQAACERPDIDFVDGTAFAPDELFLTTGQFAREARHTSNYRYLRSIREKQTDYLTTADYIWRWDTDWFWCSKQFHAQNPVVRLLATPRLLNSRTYQRLMRAGWRLLPNGSGTESVIQDVDIPVDRAVRFLEFLFAEIGIRPVWICPFRSLQVFPLYAFEPGGVYVNFGFWDVIPSAREPGYYNRRVEQMALELAGKKGLYSTSWYDSETFWHIYNGPAYWVLKDKFDPEHRLRDLYEKCVERR